MIFELCLTLAAIVLGAILAWVSRQEKPQEKLSLNTAFVFVKPHANTEKVQALVRETFTKKGLKILQEGELSAETIDEKKLIDQHYYAIASKATILKPQELNVPADKFESKFGIAWQEALSAGLVLNAMDACAKLGIDALALDTLWGAAKKAEQLVKFGGGFYCGKIEGLYVFNGFFMSMRAKFVTPGTSIHYYVVEWDAASLPWADFRGQLLGPTDPSQAPAESLRGIIYKAWQTLGLEAAPNVGDNGVHASASPFEAMAERVNWLSDKYPLAQADPFGAALGQAGVPRKYIADGCVDPQVVLPGGGKGSLFDALEDMDSAECLAKLQELSRLA